MSRIKQIQIIVRLLEPNTQRQQGIFQRLNDGLVGETPVRKRHVQNHECKCDWFDATRARNLNVIQRDGVLIDSRVDEEIRRD